MSMQELAASFIVAAPYLKPRGSAWDLLEASHMRNDKSGHWEDFFVIKVGSKEGEEAVMSMQVTDSADKAEIGHRFTRAWPV